MIRLGLKITSWAGRPNHRRTRIKRAQHVCRNRLNGRGFVRRRPLMSPDALHLHSLVFRRLPLLAHARSPSRLSPPTRVRIAPRETVRAANHRRRRI